MKSNSFIFKPLSTRLKLENLPVKGSNFVPRSSQKKHSKRVFFFCFVLNYFLNIGLAG